MAVLVVEMDDWSGLADNENAVELSASAGELKGDTSGDSGRGIEMGRLRDGSVTETVTVVGSDEGSSIMIDGKDRGECRASARRASSSCK